MFNSQKINNDPKPVRVMPGLSIEYRCADDVTVIPLETEFVIEPRPEYDNNPNPILVAFRRETSHCKWIHGIAECANLALYFEEDGDFPNESREVKDHARQVLTRLVNIYGTEDKS